MEKKKQKVSSSDVNVQKTESEAVSALNKRISELEDQLKILAAEEKRLTEGQDYFQDIFETVKEGIVLCTLGGKVLAVNNNIAKIAGVPAGKLLGRNIIRIATDFLNAEDLFHVLPLLKNLILGREIEPFQVRFKNSILEVSANINRKTKRLTGTVRDITETRKTEDALSKTELRLIRAELASKSGNWELNLDTKKMLGSAGALKLYGLTNPEIDYNDVKNTPLPEYRQKLDIALKGLIEEGKPYNIEFKIRNNLTGEILDIHSISEYDSKTRTIFGSIQDITDRKKAENETIAKSRDIAKLLEISMELLETVDRKKVFEKIVKGTPGLIGMESGAIYLIDGEEIYLQASYPPLPPDTPEIFRRAKLENHPHIRQAIFTRSQVILVDAKSAELSPEEKLITDGRDLRSMIYIPLFAAKNVVGVIIFGTIGFQHDFTEHEKSMCITLSNLTSLALENSLLVSNLTVAKEKAEESDSLKTAFLHNISHEIRTPLNAIVGFSGFLDQPDLSETERKEYIDIIYQSNNQLLSIISDILNISQIETGQVTLRESRINLSNMMRNLHRQFLDDARRAELEFRINIPCDCDNSICTDENKLIQILSNLLNNAFKFTHEGYVELGFICKENMIEFFVEDSGIGIPESEHKKIFDRFYQVDKKVSRLYSGTGLGLSISNAFVEMLGGSFSVKSSPGHGSRFSFCIPSLKPVQPDAEKNTSQSELTLKSSSRTILVAEDEESNYALVNAILKPRGFNIIRAKNGKAAVELCNSNPDIDLVLMDIKMPLMDGFEAAREILKNRSGLPVIAQTAYAHPSDRSRALETGFADYLAKPFNKEQLLDVIVKYLK